MLKVAVLEVGWSCEYGSIESLSTKSKFSYNSRQTNERFDDCNCLTNLVSVGVTINAGHQYGEEFWKLTQCS